MAMSIDPWNIAILNRRRKTGPTKGPDKTGQEVTAVVKITRDERPKIYERTGLGGPSPGGRERHPEISKDLNEIEERHRNARRKS